MKQTLKYKRICIDLLDRISTIRICENFISKFYHQNEMKTPMHMSMGEELVVSSAVLTFGNKCRYFGYYRSHALYLSLINNIQSFFGEMYGKQSGENSGVTGSMHILNPKKNLMSVSAIVSSTIGPAVGSAYASFLDNSKKITLSFFGDGATEQGVFHEALNFSSLKNLPIAFICLNNKLAVDVKLEERQSYRLKSLVKSYGIKYYEIKSFEINEVNKIYLEAKKYILKNKKPVFIEAHYHRHLQHIGLKTDFEDNGNIFERQNYRSLNEHKKNIKKDPFLLIIDLFNKFYGEKFVKNYILKKEKKILKIIEKVKKSKVANFNKILIQ